jgi:hypothetical protein
MGVMSSVSSVIASQLETVSELAGVDVAVRHLYEIDNAEMDALHVSVCPRGAEVTSLSRSFWQYEARIGVFVSRRADTNAEATSLMTTTEAIIEKLKASDTSAQLTVMVGATASVVCTAITVDLETDESMHERNVFRATMEATYKIVTNAAAN